MNKTKVLIVILLVLLIIVLSVVIYTSRSEPQLGPQRSPNPIIQFIRQSPSPYSSVNIPAEFKITKTVPDLAKQKLLRIDAGLVIVFNRPIDPTKFLYEISPKTSIISELDSTGTQLTIRGDPFWPKDTHFKLTIKSQTSSQDNLQLGSDQTFEYSTGIPEGI